MRTKKNLSWIIAILLVLQLALPVGLLNDGAKAAILGPVVTSLSPADDTSNVPLRSQLRITFDEDIVKYDLTKKVTIYRYSDNEAIRSFPMNDSAISISNNLLTISLPNNTLQLDTEYYILIDAGAVANSSNGAVFGGILAPSQWNFKTTAVNDTKSPTIVYSGLCGSSGTCNVTLPLTTSITLTFSEPVYVNQGTITLSSTDDAREIAVSSSEITGNGTDTLVIKPNTALKPSSLYTLKISNTNIIDAAGNSFSGGSYRFNTEASPLNLIEHTPKNGAINVNKTSNLELIFDQDVSASTSKKITVKNVSTNGVVYEREASHSSVRISGSKVTINIPDLSDNTSYYVTVEPGAFYVKNHADKIYSGISSASDWRFQTGHGNDKTRPVISEYSPTRNSNEVGTAEKIILKFSEPVYASNGTIEIREYNSGAIYRSIDVTSNRVTGGGTDTITIDPHAKFNETAKTFSLGTRYYVTISNNAFSDIAGNTFIGLSNKTYNFTVANHQVGPQLESLLPVNLSTTVPINGTFTMKFDKAVSVDANNTAMIVSLSNQAPSVTATLSVNPKNNKEIIITPNQTLQSNTEYYINIDNDSIIDQVGNHFVGIKNQYQWKFKTLGGDTTPPSIVKSEVSNNTIRLVYNETLNEKLKPTAASFYVTVAGAPRNINNVKVEGNVVFLTLVSAVSSNQQVLISYSKGSLGLIQDLTGNEAADFANRVVTNGFTEANPVVSSSSYNGSTITLTFSENLETLHSLAYTQFTVTANNRIITVNRIAQTSNSLVITLNESIASGSTVVVNYVQGLYPIMGKANNKVASFSHTVGTTTGTVTGAPALQRITLSGNTLSLKYNKAILTSSKPGTYQYSVLVNNRATSVRSTDVNNDTVTLTLSSTPSASDTIYVTYYGTGSTILDSAYNSAPSFTNVKVTAETTTDNNTGTAPVVQGAVLRGDVLTINFSGALDSNSVPSSTNFLVNIADNIRVINNVTINGSQLILKLSVAAKIGEVTRVSYFNTNGVLKSSSGLEIAGFTDLAVANQTTVLDSLSNDYGSDPTGIIIRPTASATSPDVTPGGYSVNRYTLNNDKLITAISTMADAKLTQANIIFEVPSTERAANVAFSVMALEYASRKGDYTIVVKHGDTTYSMPVSSLDITHASSALNGNTASNYVQFIIEEGSTPATSSLTTAINRSGATLIEGPFYFDALVLNGSRSTDAVIKGNITRTVTSTKNINNANTAAVFYDEVVGQISYVPTQFSKSGTVTTITFKHPGNSAYAIVSNNKLYSDSANHWAISAISTMTRKFIADGHSTTEFNPKTNITRGEFATYIVRGLGLSADKEAAKQFRDVNSNSVMGGYIGAAVKAGLVAGVSSNSFDPNSYITRQDMAIMLIRVANYAGMDTKLSGTADQVLLGYSDRSSISTYAKTGLAQAIQLGIISGTTQTTLSPKANADRAQGVVMIYRLLENAGYLQN